MDATSTYIFIIADLATDNGSKIGLYKINKATFATSFKYFLNWYGDNYVTGAIYTGTEFVLAGYAKSASAPVTLVSI